MEKLGGLHVLCAFLPTTRVEKQVFGRAARNGQQGSGSMVLWLQDVKKFLGEKFPSSQTINSFEDIRDIRDEVVKERLTNFVRDELPLSMLSGQLFQKMCVTMSELRELIEKSKMSKICKDYVQKQCEERWAFWLDIELSRIKHAAKQSKATKSARYCIERKV